MALASGSGPHAESSSKTMTLTWDPATGMYVEEEIPEEISELLNPKPKSSEVKQPHRQEDQSQLQQQHEERDKQLFQLRQLEQWQQQQQQEQHQQQQQMPVEMQTQMQFRQHNQQQQMHQQQPKQRLVQQPK